MSKVKIEGHGTGTGTFTVTTPSSNTDRTITLPDSTDTLAVNSDVTNKLPLAGGTMSGNLIVNASVNAAGSGTGGGFHFADGNAMIYRDTNDMVFKLQGAEKIRLPSSGGITFNGDTAAANALNDYEEGTWTIAFQGATFSGGNRTGYYVKVGNLVYATVYCGGITISNITATSTCSGLPYNMASLSNHYAVGSYVHGNAVTGIQNFYLDYTNNKMYPVTTDTTSTATWATGANKHLMIAVTYRTA